MTQLVLGGIPVTLYSGAPGVSYGYRGGATDVSLSQGDLVRMRHFNKRLITISGTGWLGSGLDGLDWDARHLLESPVPMRVTTKTTTATLTADARADEPVSAQALVGERWVNAEVAVDGRAVTITPVTGASLYTVAWYPRFVVLCDPPPEDYAAGGVEWQLVCYEV